MHLVVNDKPFNKKVVNHPTEGKKPVRIDYRTIIYISESASKVEIEAIIKRYQRK